MSASAVGQIAFVASFCAVCISFGVWIAVMRMRAVLGQLIPEAFAHLLAFFHGQQRKEP